MANYQVVMASCNFTKDNRLTAFIEQLPQGHREQFQAIISEGQLVARTVFRASLDAADTLHGNGTRLLGSTEYCGESSLDGRKLFWEPTGESVHALKDSRPTLQSLGMYTHLQIGEGLVGHRLPRDHILLVFQVPQIHRTLPGQLRDLTETGLPDHPPGPPQSFSKQQF